MNLSRARELFSAYFEGELDVALKQQFEVALQSSEELQDEYASFVAFYSELNVMASEEIEVPIYLSDRIATRLEAAQSKAPAGLSWLTVGFRKWAMGALAAVALFGTVATLNSTGNTLSGMGAIGDIKWPGAAAPAPAPINPLDYEVSGGSVSVVYQSKEAQTLLINGKAIRSDKPEIEVPLKNPNEKSMEMSVVIDGGNVQETVIVPGTERSTTVAGTGLVNEFGKALADKYNVPVRLTVTELKTPLAWNFTSSNAYEAAKTALVGTGYTADKRENGMIVISGK